MKLEKTKQKLQNKVKEFDRTEIMGLHLDDKHDFIEENSGER
jgi:hypothetical protein